MRDRLSTLRRSRSSAWLLCASGVLATVGCSQEKPKRTDDLSALTGDYERSQKDLLDEVTTAKLIVTQKGMSFEDGPMRDSVVFDEIVCETPSSCTVRGLLCSITLEKRGAGDLVVNTDQRCDKMAGLWLAKGARPQASSASSASAAPAGSGSAAPAAGSAATTPSAAAAEASSPEPEASSFSLVPEPRAVGGIDCLRNCNQTTMACARGCKSGDLACTGRCNDKGFLCAMQCSGL
ncbi:MAG: hypothetical protein HOW73_14420 [Polyangiaceae bacterium]|nr:hypothetical protein [Polyangiaceae bacterium]